MSWIWTIAFSIFLTFSTSLKDERKLDLEFDSMPLAVALQMIGQQSGANIISNVPSDYRATATLKGVTVEQALELLTRPHGLAYAKVEGAYVVATPENLKAYEPAVPARPATIALSVYSSKFVTSASLIGALKSLFPELTIIPSAVVSLPQMSGSMDSESESATPSTEAAAPAAGREIIIRGPADMVAEAVETAKTIDKKPVQVKIEVIVTDVNRTSLGEMGILWDWSKSTWQEIVRPSERDSYVNDPLLKPSHQGPFWRSPLSIEATLKAMEQKGNAKLLAHPNVMVMNGETGHILIGDRLLYPVVTGTTTAGTPLFDVREQEVGVVLRVQAWADEDGNVTLDIYPQVSVVTGFLRIGESTYPQISTREVRTKIRVKSGSQIALGGLIREEETRSMQAVPILSQIPVLGELFKHRRATKSQNELLIFLSPTIISDEEEGQ